MIKLQILRFTFLNPEYYLLFHERGRITHKINEIIRKDIIKKKLCPIMIFLALSLSYEEKRKCPLFSLKKTIQECSRRSPTVFLTLLFKKNKK
jgi:hypothetical protein